MFTPANNFLDGPLDTLVLTQLNELRRAEDDLVRRYASIQSERSSLDFASEVSELHRRADRLHRMLEGMSMHPGAQVYGPNTPLAA